MASIIEGLLVQRPHRQRATVDSVPQGGRVVRCDSLDEARSLAAAAVGVSIITADSLSAEAPLTDALGNPVRRFDATRVTDALLGRTLPIFVPQSLPQSISAWATSRTKRGVDMLVAAIAILVFWPAMVATGLVIWAKTKRSPLDRQLRLGRHGDPICLIRFRNPSIPETPYGSFLSTYRPETPAQYVLLRMPMLFNVLRGDLSFVGPAPQLLGEPVAHGSAIQLRRSVRPGCLQWKPVPPRHQGQRTELALTYDLYYVRSATPQLDLRIVATAFKRSLAPHRWRLAAAKREVDAGANTAQLEKTLPSPAPDGSPSQAGALAGRWESALIIGTEVAARLVALKLLHHPEWKILPVGFISDWPGRPPKRIVGVPVLGHIDRLTELIVQHGVDTVIVTNKRALASKEEDILASIRRTGARLMWLHDEREFLRSDSSLPPDVKVDPQLILGRPPMVADAERCHEFLAGKRVLITGAAGSIGQELARQALRHAPGEVILLDTNETGLFDLNIELRQLFPAAVIRTVVASVTSPERIADIFQSYQPQVVLHAAAYKHVPMMEDHPQEAVLVNALGTWRLAHIAARHNVERFVLISTDKAVRPSSVMGASKRLAELAVRSVIRETGLPACCVRFGNVLGSRGSVIPTFEKQIAAGGPITITDPRMRRYFMTIPEAASLTIQAATYTDLNAIFMLNMGEEVYIRELAERLVQLHGKTIGRDIQIEYIGLREGEKLREELALDTEIQRPTDHPDIFLLEEPIDPIGDLAEFRRTMRELERLARLGHVRELKALLFATVAAPSPSDVVPAVGRPVQAPDRDDATFAPDSPVIVPPPMLIETSDSAFETSVPDSD